MGRMLESYAEFYAGLIFFLVSIVLLYTNIISPALTPQTSERIAGVDKAVTFTKTLNQDSQIHDQKVERTPGIDPVSGFTAKDSGSSRMYFRPEQFIMLPVVDTDISGNPNVVPGTRTIAISETYNGASQSTNPLEPIGLSIGVSSLAYYMNYTITRDSLSDKQLTYDSIPVSGVLGDVQAKAVYSNSAFGDNLPGNSQQYGGFNLTVDSTIDPVTKKKSNSLIFVAGRVPGK